ncbi:MAG: response regulator [Desulfobacterales bacterium]|nr:response regulator [Desulfobacterales bacterium]
MNPVDATNTILVVAEESDTRIFLSNLLRSGGFTPVSATTMAQGLQRARAGRPNLIILDVMMPNKEGIRMYHHLKNDTALKAIPVIMLSAIDRETFFLYERFQSTQKRSGLPKPDAYLEKPPEADELIRLARSLTRPGEKDAAAVAHEVTTT